MAVSSVAISIESYYDAAEIESSWLLSYHREYAVLVRVKPIVV